MRSRLLLFVPGRAWPAERPSSPAGAGFAAPARSSATFGVPLLRVGSRVAGQLRGDPLGPRLGDGQHLVSTRLPSCSRSAKRLPPTRCPATAAPATPPRPTPDAVERVRLPPREHQDVMRVLAGGTRWRHRTTPAGPAAAQPFDFQDRAGRRPVLEPHDAELASGVGQWLPRFVPLVHPCCASAAERNIPEHVRQFFVITNGPEATL